MFIQVIRGKVGDPEGARRQMDRWMEELRPSSKGFLGTTAGVTSEGEMIALARFESAELARANSDRPEQGNWWQDMSKNFSGEVTFKDSSDVDVVMGGGSNDAGFVQIMTGRAVDKARARALQSEMAGTVGPARPEVLGGVLAWHEDGTFTEAVYFKSEDAARAGEKGELPAVLADLQVAMPVTEFLDLSQPWIW
jgi:hypothetical protein